MRTLRRAALSAVVLFAVVTAAPQAAAAHPPQRPGTVVSLAPLAEPLRLAGAGRAWLVHYRSTGWDGESTVVSGTITLPAGRPPRAGWPVVSFGHGFGGTADACASSYTGPSPWERAVQETLLGAGYAVAVTDYDGIGTPGESSVVDGASQAYALIDIVRATRTIAPVSRVWAGVGYSLGGYTALWAGAVERRYAPELHHVGTVALAPITQWGVQLASPAFRDPAGFVVPTAPFQGRSAAVTTPGYRAADWFTPAGLALVELAGSVCIDQMAALTAGMTNGEMYLDPPAAADEFATILGDDEVPVARYPKPVFVAHGTDDQIPIALTQLTVAQLAAAGTDVTFAPVPGADHITLLPTVAPQVLTWTDQLFGRR